MFTVNCLNPGVMPSVRFPPFNRKHFVSLGEDKSLTGEGEGGGGGGEILYVPSDNVWFVRVVILKYAWYHFWPFKRCNPGVILR